MTMGGRNPRLPGFKIGNNWYARRSTLLNHFAELEVGHE